MGCKLTEIAYVVLYKIRECEDEIVVDLIN